jgi:hypothetical protein
VLLPQRLRRGLAQLLRHGAEQRVRGLEQDHAHVLDLELGEVARERQAHELG